VPTIAGGTAFEHEVAFSDASFSGPFADIANWATGGGFETTSPIDGAASLHLVGAAGSSFWIYNFAGSPNIVVAVCYCYFNSFTLPSAGSSLPILSVYAVTPNNIEIGVVLLPDGTIGYSLATGGATGPTLVTNQLYRVEMKLDMSANPWTIVGGVAAVTSVSDTTALTSLGTGTVAQAANPTVSRIELGSITNNTFDILFDNLLWSYTAADWPIGPIIGRGYELNAVGSHNLDASPSLFYSAHDGTTAIALTTSETTSYTDIDEVPIGSDSARIFIAPGSVSNTGGSATGAAAAASISGTWTSITNAQGTPQNAVGAAFTTTNAASAAPGKNGSAVAELSNWTGLVAGSTITALTANVRAAASATGVTGETIKIDLYNGTTLVTAGTAQTLNQTAYKDWTQAFSGVSIPAANLRIRVTVARGNTNTSYTAAVDGASLSAVSYTTLSEPVATTYAEYAFADESVLTSAPIAVVAGVVANLDSAVASTWRTALYDGTNVEDIYNASISAAAKTYQGKVFSQRPNSGGAWTLAALNALRLRFGLSAVVDGNPRLEGAIIEAFFSPSTAVAYTESATITSLTTPSAVETEQAVESATITSKTSPSSSEIYTPSGTAYTESATITTSSKVTSAETAQYVDSSTVSSKTTPTTSDLAAYTDANTVQSVTSITQTDTKQVVDANTGSVVTVVISSESAQFADSNTIVSNTKPSSVEEHDTLDSATVSSKSSVISTDILGAIDASTATSKTTPSSTETHEIPDSSSITGFTTVTTLDTAQYVDQATTNSVTSVISVEVIPRADSATLITTTAPSSADVLAAVESSTVVATTTPSSTELHEIADTSTITGKTTVTTLDTAQYVDAATTASTTTVTSTDIAQYVDAATTATTTTPSTSDVVVVIDASTGTTTTTVSSADIAAYIDAATLTSKTTVTSTEQRVIFDSSTVTGKTSVTTLDTAQYVDSNSVRTVTTPSADEQQSGATADANTLKTITSITYTEAAQYIDANTATSKTSVSTTDTPIYGDSGTSTTTTKATSTDVAAYVDAATTHTTTTPSAVEVGAFTDSATFTSLTSISYTDIPIHADSDSVIITTTLTSAEVVEYVDFNTVTAITLPSALETKSSGNTDFATVTTITYIIAVREGIFLLVDLIPSPLLARWYHTTTLTSRYPVRVFQKWAAGLLTNRYNVKDYKKWVTSWIR
jgi:trimeric autotransporter adhesin